MSSELARRLRPCGPILDPGVAALSLEGLGRAAGLEGWSDLLDAAAPALAPVFAAAPYLRDLAVRDPARLGALLGDDPDARLKAICGAAAACEDGVAQGKVTLRGLKAELHLLTALCDLGGVWGLEETTLALSLFADAAIGAALRIATAAEASAGRLEARASGAPDGLFVLALGKLGAFELNYSSDVDLTVFYDPSRLAAVDDLEPQRAALAIVKTFVEVLQERTQDGYVFRVDLRLRPDPSSTPVAVPVEAAFDYYETVGQNWERAAMIKARVVAGDSAAGEAFLSSLSAFVWRRNLDYGAIADIHAIKRQIHVHKVDERLTAAGANLKLGTGGIREIEFFVQTQQLIYGGREPRLRDPRTLQALSMLFKLGLVTGAVEADLAQALRTLRGAEHRVQMVNDEQTHVLPESSFERRRVAALSGFLDLSAFDGAMRRVRLRVNQRYGELFAGDESLSSRLGSLVFTGVEDDPETLLTLSRMGFSQPLVVSGLIRSWHHGRIPATRTPRGRELFTRLAPRLLEAARATGAPEAAFNRFADFFTALSSGVQVQALFLAQPRLFGLLVEVLAFAPRLAFTLARQPAALDAMLDARFLGPFDVSEIRRALLEGVAGAGSFEGAMDAARRIHREEMFRIGVRILSGTVDAAAAGEALAGLADACIGSLAPAAERETERVAGDFPGAVAIVALGKAGSRELTVGSDLDLMTLYEADGPDATSRLKGWSAETYFARFTQRLVSALSAPTPEGAPYKVDLQLRPSGTSGPVAVSMAAFEEYYAKDAETWEFLALTRARCVWASSAAFANRVDAAVERALRRPRSLKRTSADVSSMRALMRKERPAQGPWDLKLTAGGLVDIEFAAQFLQLVAAADAGPLRTNTADALEALEAAGAADPSVLRALRSAWRLQQDLSQVLRLAFDGPQDPGDEPLPFRRLLAKAAGFRSWPMLRAELRRSQEAARAALATVLRVPAARGDASGG